MENYLFVKAVHCYADEFDTQEIAVWSVDKYEQWKRSVEKAFANTNNREVEMYFGTNELLTFSSAEEVFAGVTVTFIREDIANTLKSLLSPYGDTFGTGPVLGYSY